MSNMPNEFSEEPVMMDFSFPADDEMREYFVRPGVLHTSAHLRAL